MARELAALRLSVGEVVTREYLRDELEELRDLLAGRTAAIPAEKPGRDGAARALDTKKSAEYQIHHCATPVTRSYVW